MSHYWPTNMYTIDIHSQYRSRPSDLKNKDIFVRLYSLRRYFMAINI